MTQKVRSELIEVLKTNFLSFQSLNEDSRDLICELGINNLLIILSVDGFESNNYKPIDEHRVYRIEKLYYEPTTVSKKSSYEYPVKVDGNEISVYTDHYSSFEIDLVFRDPRFIGFIYPEEPDLTYDIVRTELIDNKLSRVIPTHAVFTEPLD